MASTAVFSSKPTRAAVGSKRSRAAAFDDVTIDEAVGSTSRESGSISPDVQVFSTSSAATVSSDKGEPNGQTANTIAAIALGDRGLLLAFLLPLHSFAPAPHAAGEPMAGREEPGEGPDQLPIDR